MTDKEIRERIESALATMRQAEEGKWLEPYMAAHKQLFDLCAALKANPPLAEVETEIVVGILDIHVDVEDGPVTVTLRKKELEAV